MFQYSPRMRRAQSGAATLEVGMLVPILFLLFLGLVQIVIYLQSKTATQYAAFTAARAYQVYGDRTLKSVDYPHVREAPYTNDGQTIAEAAAEKVIFESLMWEHQNIDVAAGSKKGGEPSLDRYYRDGNDLLKDGVSTVGSEGIVRVNLRTGLGAQVLYCLPIVFPGTEIFAGLAKKKYPCTVSRFGRHYSGIAIEEEALFGREPQG
ncbi:MAG TPA: TadE family protein [Bdellovibrionota bacterium]|nr:TadE family protein [Bdellovibrionota bacterium]